MKDSGVELKVQCASTLFDIQQRKDKIKLAGGLKN